MEGGIITKLRKRAGLLVVTIGVAMGLFVLMDALHSRFYGQDDTVAVIGDTEIPFTEYDRILERVKEYHELMQGKVRSEDWERIHQEAWNRLLLEYLVKPQMEAVGLVITSQELAAWLGGPTPHPIIAQLIVNPQTGRYDPAFMQQFVQYVQQNPQSQEAKWWSHIKELVYYDLLQQKFAVLLLKGWFVPDWLAQETQTEIEARVQAQALFVPYTTAPEIDVSDDEVLEYMQEHFRHMALKVPMRYVNYVAVPILPASRDTATIVEAMTQCLQEWAQTSDDSAVIRKCSDQTWQDRYWKPHQLQQIALKDTFFKVAPGTVVGPVWQAGGDYGLLVAYKVLDQQEVPDSVFVRHIFIQAVTRRQKVQALRLLDSLKQLVESGQASFDSLAVQFSQDPNTAQQGGRIGWMGNAQTPPELYHALFVAHRPGELFITSTRQGVHLFALDSATGFSPAVRLGVIVKSLYVSSETMEELSARINQFYTTVIEQPDSFVAIARRMGFEPALARLRPSQFNVPGLGPARTLVRWAFLNDPGSLSDVMELERAIVVAYLKAAYDKGDIPVEDVFELAKRRLINERKGRILEKQLGTDLSFAHVQQVFETQPIPVQSVFVQDVIPGIGMERTFLGSLFGTKEGAETPLVLGENGLIKGKVEKITVPQHFNVELYRPRLEGLWMGRAQQLWLPALADYVGVEDLRYRFY